jgi:hypothetical protein
VTEHIAAVEPLPCAENAVAAQDVVAVDFFFLFFSNHTSRQSSCALFPSSVGFLLALSIGAVSNL